MRIRSFAFLTLSIFCLLVLTQCSPAQSTLSQPTETSVPATLTAVPATSTSVPPTPTTAPATPTSANPTSSAGLDGAALVSERCTVCHSAERIENAAKDRDQWEDTVKRMIGKGAQLTSDEKDILINYLAETYK